jgi:DMSO/TMAO reductase YedYZ molybdopterin-dependent catalytic subunit
MAGHRSPFATTATTATTIATTVLTRRGFVKLFALSLVALAGCDVAGPKPQAPKPLVSTEIGEYQGVALTSLASLRDNSIKGPQAVNVDVYRLEVAGLVDKPLSLAYDQVLDRQRYQKLITMHCVEGWDAIVLWEGVLIDDVLGQAGVKSGASTVIFHSADGYTSSLPLSFVREKQILLASKMNDVTLPPERGFPFHVVAESKWGYKWAKWVTKIELSDDPDFRGYWESNGYSNDGDANGPRFDLSLGLDLNNPLSGADARGPGF